jgi:predicted lysophospholipase L1 biosynthesis ABC-type transport system permease subunit
MERIAEDISLVFIGALVAVVSLLTGFPVRFPPYRLWPFIFTVSAICVIVGAFA